MATSRIKTSSILQGFPKSRSVLAGNAAYEPGSYYSIETITVGSGGSSTVTFSSIPSTYTHLQVRCLVKTNRTSSNLSGAPFIFNSDSATNYSCHEFNGNGSTLSASNTSNGSSIDVGRVSGNSSSANVFGVEVIDILDYKNTNKYKTIRVLNGFDNNGSGVVAFASGSWRSTSAITSITFQTPYESSLYLQYSEFALYGIKA
jgi:hypothetical protein